MNEYVCGFAFCQDQIVLVRKLKPAWQYGRLNGVGGKKEASESWRQTQAREFKEETGLEIKPDEWNHFATLQDGKDFMVLFFYAEVAWERLRQVRTQEAEQIVICSSYSVNQHNAIPNLTWLVPMARNLRHEISPRKARHIVMTEVYD